MGSSAVAAEQVVGAFIFGRHGDRLTKPTTTLTNIGANQLLSSGKFYHDRYFSSNSSYNIAGLNISYHSSQFMAQAPNSDVIQMSQTAFLQGLYPPLDSISNSEDAKKAQAEAIQLAVTLANGSDIESPLDGYQYVVAQGVDNDAPDMIWIKGDENCPAFDEASTEYYKTEEFKDLNSSTLDFYQGLSDAVGKGIPKWKLNYGQAYAVFDYINVNRIHDAEFAAKISDDDFNKVKLLQDQYTTRLNYNASNDATTIGGQTLLAAMYSHLNTSLVTKSPLLTLFTGSYDTFTQFFGLAGLIDSDPSTFSGLVNYGASIVLELFYPDSSNDDVQVRFLLRNGTESTDNLTAYSIFDQPVEGFSFSKFTEIVQSHGLADLSAWCSACNSWSNDLCVPLSPQVTLLQNENVSLDQLRDALNKETSSLTLAGAGGIGAGVTVFVALLLAGAVYAWKSMRKTKPAPHTEYKEADLESATTT